MAPITRRNNASKPTNACQPKLKNVMVELSLKHNKKCMLCGHKEISEKLYGQLYQLNDVIVHYFCILLSSRAIQNGTDNEGIWGFLLKDIKAELTRGAKETCYYCNKKGATISCSGAKCRKVFHLPCGLKNGSMHQYFQSFNSFCQKHRIPQIVDLSELKKSTTTQCAICKDAVKPSPGPTSIWAPCCKHDAWFHRECVQNMALSAGYFFKCPLCNDVDKFKSRMLTLGIYIPSRDASWETVPNAFAELSDRRSACSVKTCLCPHQDTRNFQLPSGSWEIILCNSCGSNGTHRLCGSIKIEQEWCCVVCKGVKDDPKKKSKIQIQLLDSGNCSGSLSMFEEQSSSHNREFIQRLNSDMMGNRDQPQSSDNSILVLDSDDSNHSSVQCISDVEPPNTHAVEQSNTYSQVEQPEMMLPRITGYGSISTGVFRRVSNSGFPLFADHSMSIDLTSDNDDDD